MPFLNGKTFLRGLSLLAAALTLAMPRSLVAQRDARPPAVQAFEAASCRPECTIDTLQVDVERGRRAQPGVVTATLVLIDTIQLAKRGAPPAPRERPVGIWVLCDSSPCGAAIVTARLSDKRLDDARVARRTLAVWTLPLPLIRRLQRATAIAIGADGRLHPLAPATVAATKSVLEGSRSLAATASYSPRAMLYVATFAAFGTPGDSTMAEDVGTATEPLMIPDPTTTMPTRVATLTLAGRGPDAVPLLVQDDGTGAAPIFGIGESVVIALPGKVGRRGVVTGKVLARQRVEALRDACQGMKLWTYLVALSAADLAAAQRTVTPPTRPGDVIDRWNGAAVRETYPARMTPVEQRAITASRTVVAQFAREAAASGIRERDVQVLAALPRGTGFVTNFGVFAKDGGGNWRFPTFNLRPATCP